MAACTISLMSSRLLPSAGQLTPPRRTLPPHFSAKNSAPEPPDGSGSCYNYRIPCFIRRRNFRPGPRAASLKATKHPQRFRIMSLAGRGYLNRSIYDGISGCRRSARDLIPSPPSRRSTDRSNMFPFSRRQIRGALLDHLFVLAPG